MLGLELPWAACVVLLAPGGPHALVLRIFLSRGLDRFCPLLADQSCGCHSHPETDAMFASLGKAYQKRSTELLYWLQSEPAFDKFRSDDRFRDLTRRIGPAAAQ